MCKEQRSSVCSGEEEAKEDCSKESVDLISHVTDNRKCFPVVPGEVSIGNEEEFLTDMVTKC